MPRPLDEFMEMDRESDHEAEERRIRSRQRKRERRSAANESTTSYLDDSMISDENLFSSESQNQSFQNDSQLDYSDKNASPKNSSAKKKKTKSKDDDDEPSSEEERWLHAIEAGKLEEVDDELKKIKPKDPKLMTARQRAMLERKSDKDPFAEQLLSLPSGYREKIVTPEMLEEKAKKLQKRKQLADEKRENDKKKTMERLLKKSESKSMKLSQKLKGLRKSVPLVTYTNRVDSVTISMPVDVSFPLNSTQRPAKPPVFCGVENCRRIKKYSCSKTGVPLCSLECYKKNLKRNEIRVVVK